MGKPSWTPGGGGQKTETLPIVVSIVSAVVLTLGILGLFVLQGKEVSVSEALVVMGSVFAVLGLGGAKTLLRLLANRRGGGGTDDDGGSGPAIGGGMLLVIAALLGSGCY